MNHVWWGIRDQPVEELITAVLAPAGLVRDPRFYDGTSLDEGVVLCLVLRTGWTVVVVPEGDEDELSTILQVRGRDVVHAIRDDDNEWATLNGYRDGVECWTVYGAVEDDYMRVGGALPPVLDELAAATEDCDEVVVEMSRALLGFAIVDSYEVQADVVVAIAFRRELPKLELEEIEPVEVEIDMTESPAPGVQAGVVHGDDILTASVEAYGADRVLVKTFDGQLLATECGRVPPVFYMVSELKVDSAAFTPWGTTLVACVDPETSNSIVLELGGGGVISLPFGSVDAVMPLRDGVLVTPAGWASGHAVPHIVTVGPMGQRLLHALAVPPGHGPDTEVGAFPDPAVALFGDGSFALAWMGQPYRWHAGHVTSFPAAQDLERTGSVTLPDGSVLASCGGQLVRLTAAGERTTFAGLASVRHVLPGPDCAIVIDGNIEAAFVIVWPGQRLTHVSWEALTREEETDVIYYDARLDSLVWIGEELRVIEWRVLAALPRT